MASIQHCSISPTQLIKARKRNKRLKKLKGRKRKVTNHRSYNCLLRKAKIIHRKIIRNGKSVCKSHEYL